MYPINVTTGEAGARSKGLGWAGAIFMVVKMLLALPHLIIVSILGRLAAVVAYFGFFFVAFTGVLPGGLRDMLVAVMRWEVRTYAWVGALTDEYPPFVWEETDYVAKLSVEDPPQRSKGWAVAGIFLVKFLVLIPHLFVLAFVAVGAFFAMWFNFFKIAFTGESSPAVHDFLTGTIRWGSRVEGWIYGLTDEYPPFRLEP
jgi:hypothetical protein